MKLSELSSLVARLKKRAHKGIDPEVLFVPPSGVSAHNRLVIPAAPVLTVLDSYDPSDKLTGQVFSIDLSTRQRSAVRRTATVSSDTARDAA